MDTEACVEFLKSVPLFSGLGDTPLKKVASNTTLIALKLGEVLLREGDAGEDLFLIMDGKLRVTKIGAGDEPIELAILRPGMMVGELAFLDKLPRSVTVTAKTSAHLLKLKGTDFEKILREYPDLFPKFIDDVIMKFRKSNDTFYIKMLKKNTELKKAYDELKTLDEQKSKFIGLASHEIKTPLAIMIGNLDLINDGVLGAIPEKVKQALQKISQRSRQLNQIVMQIIDVSMKNAMEGTLRKESVDLKALVDDLIDEVLLLATQRKLEFLSQITRSIAIAADPVKLRQILMNLVTNAIRFTPDGGKIEISATDTGTRVEIAVKDSGIGIPSEKHERIFLPFYSANSVEHHHSGVTEFGSGGIGLGLTIARNFAEQHGGSITLKSAPGQGSTFTIILPK